MRGEEKRTVTHHANSMHNNICTYLATPTKHVLTHFCTMSGCVGVSSVTMELDLGNNSEGVAG